MNKKVLVIYGGRKKGRTRKIYDDLLDKLNNKEVSLDTIDLSNDEIDLNIEEGYKTDRNKGLLEYSKKLRESNLLVFIYPLYWFNMPMKLKGFIDSCFWVDEAFSFKKKAYFNKGYFKGKEAIVIYTEGGSDLFHRLYLRSGYRTLRYPLKFAGINKVSPYYLDNLNRSNFKMEDFNIKSDNLLNKIIAKHID